MKKNKNNTSKSTVSTDNVSKSNYQLKSDAVEALANADKQESPHYSSEELNRYRKKSRFHIPEPVKILFIKAWFAGAVCFFILWGLGTYVTSNLDMLFVLSVVLGMVTDLLTNNVIRFIEKTPGENDKWMLFSKKSFASFFLNILYSAVIIFCVFMLYNIINYVITSITGNTDSIPLGVEPVLFGVFCMGVDMLFVGIKRLISKIVSDAKRTAGAH